MTDLSYRRRIAPTTIRYIKLGRGGEWQAECLDKGLLQFADLVPHQVAIAGDWEQARQVYSDAGETGVSDREREIRAFYEAGDNDLWITIARGHLWWAFAAPGVSVGEGGVRTRKTIAPWSCCDISGRRLKTHELSTSLTKTAAYQRTTCSVEADTYLLRRLNAEVDPVASRAGDLLRDLRSVVTQMIQDLHWRDFEVFVDLIFAHGGWRRIAAVGGSGQADSDLILQQPVTGETAFVQIKSKASAAMLRDYQARFEAYPGINRFIFACHTPAARMATAADPRMQLWLGPELAERALDAGLVTWLLARRF